MALGLATNNFLNNRIGKILSLSNLYKITTESELSTEIQKIAAALSNNPVNSEHSYYKLNKVFLNPHILTKIEKYGELTIGEARTGIINEVNNNISAVAGTLGLNAENLGWNHESVVNAANLMEYNEENLISYKDYSNELKDALNGPNKNIKPLPAADFLKEPVQSQINASESKVKRLTEAKTLTNSRKGPSNQQVDTNNSGNSPTPNIAPPKPARYKIGTTGTSITPSSTSSIGEGSHVAALNARRGVEQVGNNCSCVIS